MRWLPDPALLGHGCLTRLKNLLAIIPVMMTAYLCHMSLHPLVQDLHNYTPRRMRKVRGRGWWRGEGRVRGVGRRAGLCHMSLHSLVGKTLQ